MIDIIYGIFLFFGLIILIFITMILTQKKRHQRRAFKVEQARDYLFKKYIDQVEMNIPVSKRFFFDALINVDEQIHLDTEIRDRVILDLKNSRFVKKQTKHLNSLSSFKRNIAIYYLSKLRSEEMYELLFKRFLKEKNQAIRLKIVAYMRYGLKDEYLNPIIESLNGSTNSYHERLCTLLGTNYKRIYEVFPAYKDDNRFAIVIGLIRIGSFHADSFLIDYMEKKLIEVIDESPYKPSQNEFLIENILKNLLKHTPELLSVPKYLDHPNLKVKSYAISSLAYRPSIQCISRILDGLDNSELDDIRVKTLSNMISNDHSFLDHLLRIFPELDNYRKEMIVKVFSSRMDYIIVSLFKEQKVILNEILNLIIKQKITEPVIDFLNNNKDKDIEFFLLEIIKIKMSLDSEMTKEFRTYLNQNILNRMGLLVLTPVVSQKEKSPVEKTKIYWIVRWVTFSFLVFPIIYLIRNYRTIFDLSFYEIFVGFLIDVNIYLIFYFVTVNLIYIILFILALNSSRKQVILASTKKKTLLFSERLLPGISIIAPAYNEEVSIIESVTSLLNLQYPIYEVIVVNDGSKDKTLQILIDHFHLERKHPTHRNELNTKKIRGIYQTKEIHNLIVVDKQNGGKADALNVGINVSKQPYVCGIDADSILESDALLKLSSAMLDDTKPFLAMGGNIYPANGFTFDRGKVEKRSIPKEMICRFQTIEYLRAFTSGRIGWSELKSLMIISGAFGLFQKETLIETGGYLTSSSKLKKDTVGEDMELVVRLTRQALEKKDSFRVAYVYNAYCYTELPSDVKTLLKQRNRWQRGLIDILSYHRKLAFDPRYKQIGMIGYPYFFIFEFLGPFFEAQGYLVLITAIILGLLNPVILLGIFGASILFGVVISLSSLYMSEKELLMMNKRETFVLIFYAILENFGYRQMISMHRVLSTFSALKESGSWGTQKRKGFKT